MIDKIKVLKFLLISIFILPFARAHAWESTEFEITLMQLEGARIDLISRINPDKSTAMPLSPAVELGITESKVIQKDLTGTESNAFFNAGLGVAAKLNLSNELIQFSELIVGADGLSLKDLREGDAKHLTIGGRVGLRFENARRFVTLGVGLQTRTIPEDQIIMVNQQLLTAFKVSPSLGLGWIF